MSIARSSGYRRRPGWSLLAAVLLGGCGAHWHPYTAEDTVCLNRQVYSNHLSIGSAVAACGRSVPDLTGDENLQQVARRAGVPFRIDPTLDRNYQSAARPVTQPGASFIPLY